MLGHYLATLKRLRMPNYALPEPKKELKKTALRADYCGALSL